MTDPLHRFTPSDHVVLGERLRSCREAVLGLLVVASPEHETTAIARQAISAVDRLRSSLDCHLHMTRSLRNDPRHLTRHIYGGQSHMIGRIEDAAERIRDDFAGWELEDE